MAEKETKGIIARAPVLTLFIIFISVLSFINVKMSSFFIFDRAELMRGEIWRLFTSHFVHFSKDHLVYNLLAFGTFGWIVERRNHLHFGLMYMLMAPIISSSLFILKPGMGYYGGLSGMACGFIFYCALLGAGGSGPWRTISKLIIIFIPAKIILEVYYSASILPYWGGQVFVTMPVSHAAGIAVAFLFYTTITARAFLCRYEA
ncbi:rhombosortase [bacterium]|nr:rhombosortase [bacterium]